jgi:hypothetical protein
MIWHKGDEIPYGSKGQRDRFVYVMTEDDGGYPSITICYIHGEFRDTEPDDIRWLAISKSFDLNRDPDNFMRSYTPPIVPWIRVGNTDGNIKLANLWEIVAWTECGLPEIPDYSKLGDEQ